MTPEDIKRALAQLKDRGWSQRRIAAFLARDPSTLTLWTQGKRGISEEDAQLLEAALNLPAISRKGLGRPRHQALPAYPAALHKLQEALGKGLVRTLSDELDIGARTVRTWTSGEIIPPTGVQKRIIAYAAKH